MATTKVTGGMRADAHDGERGGARAGGRSGIAVMLRLVGLVRPMAGYMALAVGLGLIGHLLATSITVLAGYGVLAVVDGAPNVPVSAGFDAVTHAMAFASAAPGRIAAPLSLSWVFGLIAIAVVLRGVLRYDEQACNHFIAFKLLVLISDRVFRALRRLAPAKLEGRGSGDLIAVITSDIELLEVFFAHTISPVLIAVLFSVALALFIGSFHPLLALVALSAYVLVGAGVPWLAARMSGEAGQRYRAASGRLSGFVLDTLRGMDELLQFDAGERRLADAGRLDAELAADERALKRAAGASMGATHALIVALDLGMIAASVALWRAGALGFDGVLLANLAFMGSFGPVVALANLGSTLQGTFAAGNRVLDILDEDPQVEDIAGGETPTFDGARAAGVDFSYGDERVLSGISLDAPAGSIVGVTGRSGSGKSTLLRLFMRFWDVDAGRIELGGTDVRAIDTGHLRATEALVTQDTQLFHDTIRANVRIGRLDATDAEVEEACRKASVHDFIMSLPQGYETQVGELGDTLSGGERQCIGLARAFVSNAPFMLLDEPMSNLDSLNEAAILRALVREREGKTVLLVSHRASTMRVADTVVSVERGRVAS